MSTSGQRPGDYKVVCDYSNFVCWASETVTTWQGYRVHQRFIGQEAQRHPQDGPFTPPSDEGRVPFARPEGAFTFRSATAVTAADL